MATPTTFTPAATTGAPSMVTPTPNRRRSEPPDQPSPSPPAPAPVPVTPGPRATRLQQVYSKALHNTLRANSYANFAACFPTPAEHASRSLESVWRQLNTKLEESAQAEFEDIMKERDAIKGLNELDRLIGEARWRKEDGEGQNAVAPHTLNGEELYKAHLAPYLIKTQMRLDAQTKEAEFENVRLAETIQQQRQQIQQLLAKVESVVSDVEAAAKATAEFPTQQRMGAGLRKEAEGLHEQATAMPHS
ncbi:hypothetical protein KEM55_006788 [Ascosphaera atra]|nr:hypothetical protein KEM55_006788 [Ascosphaera atra]